jgi:hypothetical protein
MQLRVKINFGILLLSAPLERSEKMKQILNRLARAQLVGDLEDGLRKTEEVRHETARYR